MEHELRIEGEVVREVEGALTVLLVVAKLLALCRERKGHTPLTNLPFSAHYLYSHRWS